MKKSKLLFNSLVNENKISHKELLKEKGSNVFFEKGKETIIGEIYKVSDNTLLLKPENSRDKMKINLDEVYSIDKMNLLSRRRNNKRVIAARIRLEKPKKILALQYNKNVVEFSVYPSDRHLDRLLSEYSMPIKSVQDLKVLTRKINREIKLSKENHGKDENVPFGKIISECGAKCRHLVALEYALLKLQNKKAEVVHTDSALYPQLEELHSFLHVKLGKETYAVDPTNNIVTPLKSLKRYLSDKKKPTEYHHRAKPMRLELRFLEDR